MTLEQRQLAHPELMDLLSSVGADSPPVVRPRAGAPGSAPSPVMMHKNQSFTMVLPEELDPGSPVSTAGGETGASAAPDLSAPGPSARRDGGAGASSRRDEPGGRPESNGEASVSGQHRPGEEPPWWARVAQEIAEHTMGAVGHAQRMLAGQGDRERSGSSEAAGASSGAEGTAGGKPADRRPDAPGDAAAATTSAAAGANGGGGANKPEQQQRGEGQSGDPLLDFQKWAAEQAAGAQHAWDGMIHGAHMAFATEFLPVGLWPTEPKGGAGPGNGRDDALALALVSEDLIVTGSQDCAVRLWHAGTGTLRSILRGHKEAVRCVAVAPGGRIISGSVDKTLRVWSIAEGGGKLHKLKGHAAPVRAVVTFTLSEGGAQMAASASDDGSIRVWDIDAGALQFALLGHSGPVSAICLLPNQTLVSGSWDRLVVVWSLATGGAERVMEGHQGPIQAVCKASRGRVVSSSLDKRIRLWQTSTGACERVFDMGRRSGATALVYLDPTRFIECTGDGWLRVWDIDSGECVRTKKGHRSGVYSAAVSCEGGGGARPKLLTASSDKSVGVWDAEELDLERLIIAAGGGMDSVWAAAFAPAGL